MTLEKLLPKQAKGAVIFRTKTWTDGVRLSLEKTPSRFLSLDESVILTNFFSDTQNPCFINILPQDNMLSEKAMDGG